MIQLCRKDKEKVYKAICFGLGPLWQSEEPEQDVPVNTCVVYEKDFWKLTNFKSTKYNDITYHIIMTLIEYLYFQIYKNMEGGKAYIGKSLPVIMKNYKETRPKSVVIYSGQYFRIFPLLEFLQLYAECTLEVKQFLDPILAKV